MDVSNESGEFQRGYRARAAEEWVNRWQPLMMLLGLLVLTVLFPLLLLR